MKNIWKDSNLYTQALKILSTVGRIILGWWYYITNKNNELARRRLSVCVDCPYRKWFACGLCGCGLQAKSRLHEEDCPHPEGDKWKGL